MGLLIWHLIHRRQARRSVPQVLEHPLLSSQKGSDPPA